MSVDEDERWALVDALSDPQRCAAAVEALAGHGRAARSYAIAATHHPARRAAAAAVLARLGDPGAAERLGELALDDDAVVRAIAQVGLHRGGDRDGVAVSRAIERESSHVVLAVLAGRAASVALTPAALSGLAAQAVVGGPRELRAGCVWAVAVHAPGRAALIAGTITLDAEQAFWLATVVARRGGPLASWTAGLRAAPELDRVASLLGL